MFLIPQHLSSLHIALDSLIRDWNDLIQFFVQHTPVTCEIVDFTIILDVHDFPLNITEQCWTVRQFQFFLQELISNKKVAQINIHGAFTAPDQSVLF